MNERIKLLAEQVDSEFNSPYDRHKAIERFTELIVLECANELIKWKDEPYPYDPEFGASLIKSLFGVK